MTTLLSRLIPRGLLISGRELRTRLINLEARLDDAARETRTRLVNVEETLVHMARLSGEDPPQGDSFSRFGGSSDQGFGHRTYAQFGEDLIVANIFALLGVHHPTYLDVGANDPIAGSNTALFYARGSRGVVVEANQGYADVWRKVRPLDVFVNVGIAPERGERSFHAFDDWSGRNTLLKEHADASSKTDVRLQVQKIETVRTVLLNDIVDEYLHGEWPDFLTLDIEGLDYPVLDGARFYRQRPLVLCIETRDGAGDDISGPFLDVLKKKGYVPVFRTWGNLIAVHGDAVGALHLKPADC